MAVNPLKALLLLAAGCTAAATTVYVSDVFVPFDKDQPPAALLPDAASLDAAAKAARLPGQDGAVEQQPANAPAAKAVLPIFDVVSVQGDGSIVIAGRAAPNARVEAVTETQNVGDTTTGSNGDFVIVITLEPGDYHILLRQIIADDIQLSREAAIISVPESEDGEVLVLVEMAGEASRLIAVPNARSADPRAPTLAGSPATAPPPAPLHGSSISVEAVETEGSSMFVAGAADPGRRVLAYADNIAIGEAVASPAGRFLIETERELALGDHMIRVDAVGADGTEVLARAAVPFTNEGADDIGNVFSAPSGARASETTGARTGNVKRSVIIRRGDTLWRISRRVYGQGVRYSAIYLANQSQIKDPDRIWPGQVFRVPEETTEGDLSDMEAVGKQATTSAIE
jgi:nucleoid-associated protein YgaU